MIRLAWTFALKDLKLYFRDRTALLLSLALPLFLALIFGAAMGGFGGKESIGKVKLLVEDLDHSAHSKDLVAALQGSDGLLVSEATDTRKSIADGKAPAALVIPSGYGADVDAGRAPGLKLYRDPAKEIEQQIIAGNLLPALFQAGGSKLSRDVVKRGLSSIGLSIDAIPGWADSFDRTWQAMEALAKQSASEKPNTPAVGAGAKDDPAAAAVKDDEPRFDFLTAVPKFLGLDVEDVVGGDDGSNKVAMQSHAVSGIAVMMLLFGLVAAGGTILEEEQQGTLTRLLLSPAPAGAILLGKFMMAFLIGLVQLTILFTFGSFVFAVPVWRDPAAVLLVSVAVCAAATGLGLFLAVTCRTRKQLEGISTLIILVMAACGGSWFPLVITPAWYQKLGHFTLNAWAMDAYQGIFWYGKGISGIWLEWLVLFAIAATMSFLAARRWTRRFGTSA